MSCRQSLSPEFSFRPSSAAWQPAFAPQPCAVPTCPRMAVVAYGERLCSSCALLALEYDSREAERLPSNRLPPNRLPSALAAPEQGDAGCWCATDDPKEPFRWERLPGRIDAGVASGSDPLWAQYREQWGGYEHAAQPDSGLGQPECMAAAVASHKADLRAAALNVEIPAAEVAEAAAAPVPPPVCQPRIDLGVAPVTAASWRPLGVVFWLTLLGIGVVLKAVLR